MEQRHPKDDRRFRTDEVRTLPLGRGGQNRFGRTCSVLQVFQEFVGLRIDINYGSATTILHSTFFILNYFVPLPLLLIVERNLKLLITVHCSLFTIH